MANNEKYQITVTVEGKDNLSATMNKVGSALKGVETNAKSADNATNSLSNGFSKLNGIAGQFGLGLSLAGLVASTVQLNTLGREVNAVSHTFEQVSGGVAMAETSLSRLRSITGGVIDDLTLMKGANSLLITGIASTNEQAAELVNLGSRLGTALGVDAAESIENLNAALLNNSFVRLDTLGISAARVRERVNELKEAGLDMSAAFSQAVVEIGTQTLEDLGSAASVGETAFARLQTRANNFAQDLGGYVATNIETAATSLEQLLILADIGLGGTGGVPALEAIQDELARTIPIANQLEIQMRTLSGLPLFSDIEAPQGATQFLSDNPMLSKLFETRDFTSGTYFQDAFSGISANAEEARVILEDFFDMDLSGRTNEQLLDMARDLDIAFTASANAQVVYRQEVVNTNQAILAQERALALSSTSAGVNAKSMEVFSNTIGSLNKELYDLSDTVSMGTISTGGMTFFDPDALQSVQMQAEDLVDEYERLKELGESSEFTLVSEVEVERARQIALEAENFAKLAERGASAFANATLSQLAGEMSGGRLGEFFDMVLGGIQDEGIRSQAESQFNLASGRETTNSRVLENSAAIVSQITEEQGTAAGQRAAQAAVTAFDEGVQMGLSGEALADYIEAAIGFGFAQNPTPQDRIEVQAGDSLSAISARTGYSIDDLRAAAGGTNLIMPGQILEVGEGTQLVAIGGNTESVSSMIGGGLAGVGLGMGGGGESVNPMQWQADIASGWERTDFANEATNIASIETSVAVISETDFDSTFIPMTESLEFSNNQVNHLEANLTRMTGRDYRLQIPVEVVLGAQTAEWLSRNATFVEAIRLVTRNEQITK